MRSPWKVAIALAALWLVAWLTIVWVRSLIPSPASLEAYLSRHDLSQATLAERSRIIEHVASQINRLNFEQRDQLRRDGADREFFEKMTPEERNHFMDLTLPEGFHQLIIALNKMDPAKRRQLVENALAQMRNADPQGEGGQEGPGGQGGGGRIDDAQAQKVVSQGLETFYKDSSPEVKLDFAPVIEQIQKTSQNLR